MVMPDTARRYTVDEVLAFPDDGNRYELVDGELLVTPAPRLVHQSAVVEIWRLLADHAKRNGIGFAFTSPADIKLDPKTLVQPDVFVAPAVEGRRPQEWHEIAHLVLAVEVLSLSTARADRQVKRRLFQRQGVPEYWIVDLDARLVERWRPDDERPELLTEALVWQPTSGVEPLEIDLSWFFAEVVEGPG